MIKAEWASKSPTLSELLYPTEVILKKQKKVLIGMPCYNEIEYLMEQIKHLNSQDFLDFDLVVVLSPILHEGDLLGEFKKRNITPKFNIIFLRRNADYGSAGGFYVLEKYSVDNNYEVLIEADVDSLPLNNSVLSTLISYIEKGADIVLPATRKGSEIFTYSPIIRTAYNIRFYSAIRVSTIKKSGITYIPFFYGADDAELFSRISKVTSKIVKVDEFLVSHPFKLVNIFASSGEYIYYRTRNFLLTVTKIPNEFSFPKKFFVMLYNSFYILFSSLILFLAGNSNYRPLLAGFFDFLNATLISNFVFKSENPIPNSQPQVLLVPLGLNEDGKTKILSTFNPKPDIVELSGTSIKGGTLNPLSSLSQIFSIFNKNIAFYQFDIAEIYFPFFILLSKSAYQYQRNSLTTIKNSQPSIINLLAILLAALLIPLIIFLSVLLTFISFFGKLRSETLGYGVYR